MPRAPPVRQDATMSLQCRHYVFTINNPTVAGDEYVRTLNALSAVRYVIFQLEVGESGTPHFQGYLELKNDMRYNAACKLLGGHVHLEKRLGTRDQARAYACKDDTRVEGPWEAGEWRSVGQGQRIDLNAAIETLNSTRNVRSLAEQHPREYVRFYRGFESLYARTQPSRPIAPITVNLYYGKTGTGKTRRAYREHPDLFRKSPETRWFDGYEDQSVVLLDDFAGRASKTSLTYLLQLLDIYPIDVEVKGSYRPLLCTKILVTTNIHPRLWYDYTNREEQYQALMRRFSAFWYYPALPDLPLQVDRNAFVDQWAQYCNEDQLFQATQDTDYE